MASQANLPCSLEHPEATSMHIPTACCMCMRKPHAGACTVCTGRGHTKALTSTSGPLRWLGSKSSKGHCSGQSNGATDPRQRHQRSMPPIHHGACTHADAPAPCRPNASAQASEPPWLPGPQRLADSSDHHVPSMPWSTQMAAACPDSCMAQGWLDVTAFRPRQRTYTACRIGPSDLRPGCSQPHSVLHVHAATRAGPCI